jgi:DNA-binding transcriptional LysR family regulator
MKYFVAVVDSGSVSRAAGRLFVAFFRALGKR